MTPPSALLVDIETLSCPKSEHTYVQSQARKELLDRLLRSVFCFLTGAVKQQSAGHESLKRLVVCVYVHFVFFELLSTPKISWGKTPNRFRMLFQSIIDWIKLFFFKNSREETGGNSNGKKINWARKKLNRLCVQKKSWVV